MTRRKWQVTTMVGLGFFVADAARSASVRDVFAQFDMLGTFAINCAAPVSPQNQYTVFRALDADRVQVDLMVGPQKRQYAYIIDRAAAQGPNDIAISMSNEAQRINLLYRIDGRRLRTMESTRDGGPAIVTGGQFVTNGSATVWLNKCE